MRRTPVFKLIITPITSLPSGLPQYPRFSYIISQGYRTAPLFVSGLDPGASHCYFLFLFGYIWPKTILPLIISFFSYYPLIKI